jgi:hypothetical protein
MIPREVNWQERSVEAVSESENNKENAATNLRP